MKILIIDNYDSFTYNLVQMVEEISGTMPTVLRNDALTTIDTSEYTHVLLSPGPGLPDEAAQLLQFIGQVAKESIPCLGICLGHQAIAIHFGGELQNLTRVFHGVQSTLNHIGDHPLFKSIPKKFVAGRYHSWVVNPASLPKELTCICKGPADEVMALAHASMPMYGVQFHPESILTPLGKQLIENFLHLQK